MCLVYTQDNMPHISEKKKFFKQWEQIIVDELLMSLFDNRDDNQHRVDEQLDDLLFYLLAEENLRYGVLFIQHSIPKCQEFIMNVWPKLDERFGQIARMKLAKAVQLQKKALSTCQSEWRIKRDAEEFLLINLYNGYKFDIPARIKALQALPMWGLPFRNTDLILSISVMQKITLNNIISSVRIGMDFSEPLFEVCQVLEREDQLMVLLVFEHLEQDLSDLIDRLPKSGMPPVTILRLSRELLTGVDFLHSHRIIHRDLKPQNLLISSQGHLKIADFGLAKTYDFEMKLTSVVVTLWYRAPEVLLAQSYNSSVDIWSVACIIAEMFGRKALFPGTSEANQLDRVFELTGRPTAQQWPQSISLSREHFPSRLPKQPKELCPNLCEYANDLLGQMLSYEFRSRPSALACLEHEYFQQEPI